MVAEIKKSLIFGIGVGLIGLSIFAFRPYQFLFKKMTILYENGVTFDYWQSSKVHLNMKVHLFNITNKEAFMEGREKLRFQEVGPYVYGEVAIHHNVVFNHENGTISSNPRYSLHWDPEANVRSENEVLVLPHITMLLFSNLIVEKSTILTPLTPILNTFITSTGTYPIVEQTVKEYLFGHENAFIKVGHTLLPHYFTFDKVGILDRLYDHEGDVATTFTGEFDRHLAGAFDTYNHLTYLPQWDAPCNKLTGSSDGKKFGNDFSLNEKLYFYRKGIGRIIPMEPVSPELVSYNGIPSVKYNLEKNIFDNGRKNPLNKCFCKNKRSCLPDTFQDLSENFLGFQVTASFPHFLEANTSLLDQFAGGLYPNEEKHKTVSYINPDTGYVTGGNVRLQLNAMLGDLSNVMHCERFSNMILPLAWADFTLPEIDPVLNFTLILVVKILPMLEILLAYLLSSIGILFVMHNVFKSIFYKNTEKLKKVTILLPTYKTKISDEIRKT